MVEHADKIGDLFRLISQDRQDIIRLDTEVKGVRTDLVDVKTILEGIASRQNKGTDWPLFVGFLMLILAIVGGCGKMALDPLASRVEALEEEQLEHRKTAVSLAVIQERSRWQTFAITGEMGE